MTWFERNADYFHQDPLSEVARLIRAAGLENALHFFSGPFGVRRILIHFAQQGTSIKVKGIEAVPLQYGGGTPPPDPDRSRIQKVEQALKRLHMNMSMGATWSRGSIGFVRDCDNRHTIIPFFDEDQDLASLEVLPIPESGHPLEDPVYSRLLAMNETKVEQVWTRTSAMSPEWDVWDIAGNELRLIFGSYDFPNEIWRRRVMVLGTFQFQQQSFNWQVEEPLFEETIYCWEHFLCSWDASMELGILTTARLGGSWLFVSEVESQELALFAAVWEN